MSFATCCITQPRTTTRSISAVAPFGNVSFIEHSFVVSSFASMTLPRPASPSLLALMLNVRSPPFLEPLMRSVMPSASAR